MDAIASSSFSTRDHFVRVSVLGQVGRFVSVDPITYPRGVRVVCRTRRGLEVGEVLSRASVPADQGVADGSILRRVTAQDELLIQRLGKNRESALEACQSLLQQHAVPVVLVDVEHLFDGQSLYFYFLGDLPANVQTMVDDLAASYEAKVHFGDFARAVEAGCGPDCGTEDAEGCGDACSTCAIVNACKSK